MILLTGLAGGPPPVRLSSKSRPASASASSGPHALQLRAWAWKRWRCVPLSTPSSASVRRASNSLHCIPLLVWSGITSPAYKYVAEGVQVPPALYLFVISRYPPEPSIPARFPCSPCPVSPLESQLPAALATISPGPHARFHAHRRGADAHPEVPIGPRFPHSVVANLHVPTKSHPSNRSYGPAWSCGSDPPAGCG